MVVVGASKQMDGVRSGVAAGWIGAMDRGVEVPLAAAGLLSRQISGSQ